MRRSGYIMTLLLSMILSVSCTKEARELKYSAQEEKIEKFVTSQLKQYPDSRVEHNGGVTRIVLVEGEGLELNSRGTAVISYAGYNFSGGSISNSMLFATNDESVAAAAGWKLSNDSAWAPMRISLSDKGIIEGLSRGLEGVRKGEEAIILFSGKYGFGKSAVGTIPADAPLAYHVLILDIEN